MNKFRLKPEIYYGSNAIEYIRTLKGKKACIVTDKFMVDLGFIDKITNILDDKGVTYRIFSDVEADPSRETVLVGLQHIIEQKPDTLIAIGGGSPIDAAKAIMYFCIKTKEKLVEPDMIKKPWFVAIPTTSGTGSEVTSYAVITDKKENIKIPLAEDYMLPDVAILDYELTRTMPPSVTADTGMDVLTHAMEAYVSKEASNFTDIYAERAIETVFRYLNRAYEDSDDMEARAKMHDASCMAGIAFCNASLGINHSLAHALGGTFPLPHGRCNAMFLPYVIRFNAGLKGREIGNPEVAKKYQSIAKLLGLPSNSLLEGVLSISEGIKIMNKRFNIPNSIKEFGIDRDEFIKHVDDMAKSALQDMCTSGNPVKATFEDFKKIYMEAYE